MQTVTHLKKAPIVEALIDFRIRPSKELDLAGLESLSEQLKDRFPVKKHNLKFEADMRVTASKNNPESSFKQWQVGFRMETADQKKITQINLDGFTFSWLKPYESWEALRNNARELWELYSHAAKPEAITRVATRFINRIEIQLPMGDFREYLVAPPIVSAGLPQLVEGFLTRIATPIAPLGATIVVTQASEPTEPTREVLSILVDIDVFKEVACSPDSQEPWQTLEQFRNLKNRAFFSSITQKTKEMFL